MNEPEGTGSKQAETQFKPGQSGNPKGRPKGSRNALGEDFLKAMHEDFKEHGTVAIAVVRETKPDAYLKVVASILPKQAEITINEYEAMDDGQLRAALGSALRDLAALGVDIGLAAGQGVDKAAADKPLKAISPLH